MDFGQIWKLNLTPFARRFEGEPKDEGLDTLLSATKPDDVNSATSFLIEAIEKKRLTDKLTRPITAEELQKVFLRFEKEREQSTA